MILLATMAIAGSLVADPVVGRLMERAKGCISANAADVERAEANLADAQAFLLDDVCAAPVSLLERYQASTILLESLRRQQPADYDDDDSPIVDPKIRARMKALAAKQRELYSHASISEETGELVLPKGASSATLFMTGAPGRQTASPELRAFAARALLDARKARQTR